MAKLIFIFFLFSVFSQSAFSTDKQEKNTESPMVIALLHFAPELGGLDANKKYIQQAMTLAKANGAEWMLTPELALTGYHFQKELGTNWIPKGPGPIVESVQRHAKSLGLGVLLSHLERPMGQAESIYNTLFVINSEGEIIARHKKVNTIPQSEDWASKGSKATIATLSGYQVGLLICADAWPSHHADHLKKQGAQIIFSSANWGPGLYGPGDTWEKRSLETEVPWVVNNRTGVDKTLDLREAKSVVSNQGKRIFEHASEKNTLILLHWKRTQPTPTLVRTKTIKLNGFADQS